MLQGDAKTMSKVYLPVFPGRLFHAILAYIIKDLELAGDIHTRAFFNMVADGGAKDDAIAW